MSDLITPDELPTWVPGDSTTDSRTLGWGRRPGPGLALPGPRRADPRPQRLHDRRLQTGNDAHEPSLHRRLAQRAVTPGVISLLTHAARSHWRWSEPLEVTHLYLSPGVMAEVAADAYERHIKDVELRDILRTEDPVLTGIAACLDQKSREDGLGCRVYVDFPEDFRLACTFCAVTRMLLSVNGRSGGLSRTQCRLLDQYVEEHLDRPISLEELAGVVQLSVFHFSRKFRCEFGSPPHAYLMSKRIERARAQLARGDIPLKAVAATAAFPTRAT